MSLRPLPFKLQHSLLDIRYSLPLKTKSPPQILRPHSIRLRPRNHPSDLHPLQSRLPEAIKCQG